MQQTIETRGCFAYLEDSLKVAIASFLIEDWRTVEVALTHVREMADKLLAEAKSLQR